MLIRTFKYKTLTGKEVEDTFCFHLNKAEITKWLVTNEGSTLDKMLLKMTEHSRGRDILDTMDDLIKRSVGKMSDDEKRFIKNKEIIDEFVQTEAYSELFMELVTDGAKCAEFITKIIPDDLSKEIENVIRSNPDGIPDEMKDYLKGVPSLSSGVGADA